MAKAQVQVPLITQNDGTKIPAIGLGTYTSIGGDCEKAVKMAIDCGYRHFDTAYFYENEAEVGKAIKDKIKEGVIKREDVYIVTKLWSNFHDPERVEYACRKSLQNLGLGYIDLYLMHWPFGYAYNGDDDMFPSNANGEIDLSDVDYIDTWKAMEKLVELGLTKSIGVSNFNTLQLNRLMDNAIIKPIHNQIECNPALNQISLVKFCKRRDVIVTAYCPLGRPNLAQKTPKFLFDPKVKEIADKYGKTPAQVVLRYLIEIGTVPIPKSVTKERIEENINVFDFKLDENDHEVMDSFNTGERLVLMEHAKFSEYYPFDTES